ncbi:MAG: organic solvent tolerance protein OstA [Selenomonadaceae bacterium]|nr:organic solvent tolerance protein OstA [Selenomonadaceae bacterium]
MAIKKICAAVLAAMLVSSAATAADNDNEPSEVNADAIEYDMNTGIVTAEGNVLLKHGATKATGLHALFNVNTKAAQLIGNVIVVREDMRITCQTLASNGQGHMAADGNVIATQNLAPNEKYPEGDTRTFTGEHIDYFPDDRKYFVIPTGGVAESRVEGTFTADQIEGWIDDEHYVGRGNAHMVSTARNMEAGGDQVDYDGKDAGKAVLSGNAWAIQNNNTIRGNRLTVYLADDGNLKAEAPKFEMPPMPTADKAFDKEQATPAQVEETPAVEEKSADETIIIEPEENT